MNRQFTHPQQGQAIIEALLAVTVFTPFLVFGSWLLLREYRIVICQKGLFERTRSALNKLPESTPNTSITVNSNFIVGWTDCHGIPMRIQLNRIEHWERP